MSIIGGSYLPVSSDIYVIVSKYGEQTREVGALYWVDKAKAQDYAQRLVESGLFESAEVKTLMRQDG